MLTHDFGYVPTQQTLLIQLFQTTSLHGDKIILQNYQGCIDIAAVVCCGSTRLAHLQSNPSTFLATFKLLQIKLSRTFNGIQVRAFLLVVLKVVHHEGCVFGVVVMLEDKAATQTQLCCRLLQGSRFSRFLPL